VQGVTQTTGKVDHATGYFIFAALSIENHWMSIPKTIGDLLDVIETNGLNGVRLSLSRATQSADRGTLASRYRTRLKG
jgi:hypothetical protein